MNTSCSQSQSLSFIPEKEKRFLEIPGLSRLNNLISVKAERQKSKP